MIFDNGERAQDSRYRLKIVKAIGGRTLVRRGTFAADELRSRISRKDPTTYAIKRIMLQEKPLISNDEAAIRKSVLYRNDVGIRSNEGKPTIEDCVIAQNRGDGIAIFRSHPQIDHCLIDKNGGLGVGGVYYAHATLANSIVSNNRKGGVKSEVWDCHVSAKECAFLNNKGFEVELGTDCPWDFTENFWGDGMTSFLKARGCNVRLPKIKDKRHGDSGLGLVDVNKFLLKMPEDCGPRECVRAKGVN